MKIDYKGKILQFPDGMPVDQIETAISQMDQANEPQTPTPQQSPQQGPLSWGDVATGAVKNLPSSTAQLGKDLVHPLMHPVDTAKSL